MHPLANCFLDYFNILPMNFSYSWCTTYKSRSLTGWQSEFVGIWCLGGDACCDLGRECPTSPCTGCPFYPSVDIQWYWTRCYDGPSWIAKSWRRRSAIGLVLHRVGNLPEGYIGNVPLPRVPRDQSTFQSRVPPVHAIPVYYKEKHVIPTYNSTCRIGERVATANSPQWQPVDVNT